MAIYEEKYEIRTIRETVFSYYNPYIQNAKNTGQYFRTLIINDYTKFGLIKFFLSNNGALVTQGSSNYSIVGNR